MVATFQISPFSIIFHWTMIVVETEKIAWKNHQDTMKSPNDADAREK